MSHFTHQKVSYVGFSVIWTKMSESIVGLRSALIIFISKWNIDFTEEYILTMLNGQAVKLKNTGNDSGEDWRIIERK